MNPTITHTICFLVGLLIGLLSAYFVSKATIKHLKDALEIHVRMHRDDRNSRQLTDHLVKQLGAEILRLKAELSKQEDKIQQNG